MRWFNNIARVVSATALLSACGDTAAESGPVWDGVEEGSTGSDSSNRTVENLDIGTTGYLCGNIGGNHGDRTVGGSDTSAATLKFYFGSLHAIDPLNPSATPISVDQNAAFPRISNINTVSDVDFDVLSGTFTHRVGAVFYNRPDGTLWRVDAQRVATQGAIQIPRPTRVSSETGATELCQIIPGSPKSQGDFYSTRIVYEIPKPGGDCSPIPGTNLWKSVTLDKTSLQPPEDFPGIPIVPMIDLTNGSDLGWLAEGQGSLLRVHPDLSVVPLAAIGEFVRVLPSMTKNNKLFVNIDGSLYIYSPKGSRSGALRDTGYDFPVAETFGIPLSQQGLIPFITDDLRLYFVVNTATSGAALFSMDENGLLSKLYEPADASYIAFPLTLIGDRVIYGYYTKSGSPVSILVSIRKDGTGPVVLDKGSGELDFMQVTSASLPHPGPYLFYNKKTPNGGADAIAVRADGNVPAIKWANSIWIGRDFKSTKPLIATQIGLEAVFLAKGATDNFNIGGARLTAVDPANPGGPQVDMGQIPGDIGLFYIELLGTGYGNRHHLATGFAFGSQGRSQQDVFYFDPKTPNSLRRITNTSNKNETVVPWQ